MSMHIWSIMAGAAGICLSLSASAYEACANVNSSIELITEPAQGEREGLDIATVDVAGIASMDGLGSPNNIVLFVWVGPYNEVTGVGWDVVLQTIAPTSLRSDIGMLVTDSLALPFSGFIFTPGGNDPSPGGPTVYSSDGAILKLADDNIPTVFARSDGLIRIEFLDWVDDDPDAPDAEWVSGNVLFQTWQRIPPVPSPSAAGLFAIGSVGWLRRKRRSDN